MKREEVMLLAQLLHTMKEVAAKIEEAHKKKDMELLARAKKEFITLQRRVNELL